ncbi:C6 zinc finger domain-containing protein [Penicillium verhagenii]|uniref:C6 zinc finger domain-containing protein n=1 Tax=Penicillium verhagenii TaxID=1562060 RepID=UPI0025459C82|nr:C6 zinc finger domain-containing protein [Penicillium verhagenii]KAJ5936897.1 C6 zinc finger domain-containing protein [Penicillium verhagenii]
MLAGVVAGPLPRFFWVGMITQMSHTQPVVRHSIVAIACLQHSGLSVEIEDSRRKLAISRYNTALRQVSTSSDSNPDIVVISCMLFLCIEFMRNNPEAAMVHYQYGRKILASYNASRTLLGLYRRVNVFMLYFIDVWGLPQLNQEEFCSPGPFTSLIQAQEALDWLVYRSLKVSSALDRCISNDSSGTAWQDALSLKSLLDTDLNTWSRAFNAYLLVLPGSFQELGDYRLLQTRWQACKIWTDAGLYGYQADGNQKIPKSIPCRDLKSTGVNTSTFSEFLSCAQLSPVLYFMLMETRNLGIRLAALALLRKKCTTVETAWNAQKLYTTAKEAIEKEHGILIAPGCREFVELDNLLSIGEFHPAASCPKVQFYCPWVLVVLDVCDRVCDSQSQ